MAKVSKDIKHLQKKIEDKKYSLAEACKSVKRFKIS